MRATRCFSLSQTRERRARPGRRGAALGWTWCYRWAYRLPQSVQSMVALSHGHLARRHGVGVADGLAEARGVLDLAAGAVADVSAGVDEISTHVHRDCREPPPTCSCRE